MAVWLADKTYKKLQQNKSTGLDYGMVLTHCCQSRQYHYLWWHFRLLEGIAIVKVREGLSGRDGNTYLDNGSLQVVVDVDLGNNGST